MYRLLERPEAGLTVIEHYAKCLIAPETVRPGISCLGNRKGVHSSALAASLPGTGSGYHRKQSLGIFRVWQSYELGANQAHFFYLRELSSASECLAASRNRQTRRGNITRGDTRPDTEILCVRNRWLSCHLMPSITLWIGKRRTQKGFSYRELSESALIPNKKQAHGKIEILFEGKPVENVRVFEMEMRNSGGKELESKDFYKPVRIVFRDGTEILKAEVTSASSEFDPEFEILGSDVTLKPVPMNPGDYLTVKVLIIADKKVDAEVRGKIIGVTRLTAYEPVVKRRRKLIRFMNYGSICLLWIVSIFFVGPFSNSYWVRLLFILMLVMLGGIAALSQSFLSDQDH